MAIRAPTNLTSPRAAIRIGSRDSRKHASCAYNISDGGSTLHRGARLRLYSIAVVKRAVCTQLSLALLTSCVGPPLKDDYNSQVDGGDHADRMAGFFRPARFRGHAATARRADCAVILMHCLPRRLLHLCRSRTLLFGTQRHIGTQDVSVSRHAPREGDPSPILFKLTTTAETGSHSTGPSSDTPLSC